MWGLFGLPVGFVVCICCYILLLYLLLSPTRDGIIYLFLLRDLACRDFAAQKDFSRKCGGFKTFICFILFQAQGGMALLRGEGII